MSDSQRQPLRPAIHRWYAKPYVVSVHAGICMLYVGLGIYAYSQFPTFVTWCPWLIGMGLITGMIQALVGLIIWTRDNWPESKRKILAPEVMDTIQNALYRGPVIVEHRSPRNRGARDRLFFDDMGSLVNYIEAETLSGDFLHVWSFHSVCTAGNRLTYGRCPDESERAQLAAVDRMN